MSVNNAALAAVVLCQLLLIIQGDEMVRLSGGPNKYVGRVEVFSSGQWATVCNKNFSQSEARLICRLLGLSNVKNVTVYDDLRFGQGSGNVITDLGCSGSGSEKNMSQCMSGVWDYSKCKHSEDVAINCQTLAYLVGTSYTNNGRLELTVGGVNQSVCSSTFKEAEADVVCRMMGFSTGNAIITTQTLYDAEAAMSGLNCTGKEGDISDCMEYPPTLSKCGNVVNLECKTKIRLVNGTTNNSGTVEVYANDRWGTICDDSFDDHDASVICRSLGLNPEHAISYGSAYFGHGNGSIIIDELACGGDEEDVSQCPSKPWLSHTNCGHGEDAGVECLTEIILAEGPTQFSGRVEVKQGNDWLTFCDENFDNQTATVICNMKRYSRGNVTVHNNSYYGSGTYPIADYVPRCMGNETDIVQCTKMPKKQCPSNRTVGINCFSSTPLRLAGGWKSFVGKVEIFYKKSWTSLCQSNFSLTDAQVICTMLGHPQQQPSVLTANHFYDFTIHGEGLSGINCQGTETDISDCLSYISTHKWGDETCDFSVSNFVGVNCDPVTPIRLVDGPSVRAGRVEIMYNNTWGRVCGHHFNTSDSDVLCRMMGYRNGSVLLPSSYYNYGSSPYITSDIGCKGTEADISNCKSSKWLQSGYCSYNPVGIACKTKVRLENGKDDRSGRVEIYHNNTWGTICADTFTLEVANVVCRAAGFRFWNASVLEASKFGNGSVSLLNNITCNGTEADISMCHGGPWTATTCTLGAAAVDCRKQVTPVRLTSTGSTPYSGYVEVFYNNKWGTVCPTSFTKHNTDVLCRNMGYDFSGYASWSSEYYDSSSHYSKMITGLRCHGNESDVSACTSELWDSRRYCYSPYKVQIDCLTSIDINNGRTPSMGSIKIQANRSSSWAGICNKNFSQENGEVLCSMLGFNYTRNVQLKEGIFNRPTSQVLIDGLNCTGNEKDIYQCASNPWNTQSTCPTEKAVGINCNTPVQLTNGTSPRSGMVQVMINGSWARVCKQPGRSDRTVGQVVCSELGYYSSQVQLLNVTMDIDDEETYTVACSGSEADLSRCHIERANCFNNTVIGIACETPLSLINGRTKYMGLVQVSLSQIGGIRPTGLSDNDANHICRLLGYNFTQFALLQNSSDLRQPYWKSNHYHYQTSVVDQLRCHGNETDIADCIPNFENWYYTSTYTDNTMINCQTPLQVVNGEPYLHGDLQVYNNGTWMYVCPQSFSQQDAYVVCRMMGHKHLLNTTAYEVARSGKPSSPGLRGAFHCNGSEDDLSQCSNMSWQTQQCTGTVKVDCRASARLVDGPSPYEGRVELFYNATWWPVCYQNTALTQARVFCRMLGYIDSSPIYQGVTNMQNVSLSIRSLSCRGTENDITECVSSDWELSSCTTTWQISCYTQVRISSRSGSNPYNGLIQLNPQGSWQYVRRDSFDDHDAQVLCKMLGYDNTTARVSYRYSYSGSSAIEDLNCLGNETDVQGCNHTNWKASSPYLPVASVNCHPVTPVRLMDGDDRLSGRVEVLYDGHWGTVCNDSFDDVDASVFCSMLGHKSGIASIRSAPGNGSIIVDNLQCNGSEADISECLSAYWLDPDHCNHTKDAYIECSDIRVRLVNGHNMYRGHVEIQYLGKWLTLAAANLDQDDSAAICRELGVQDPPPVKVFKIGDIPYRRYSSSVIQDLNCTGTETSVDDCPSFPWKHVRSSSYDSRTVAINCRPHTPIRLVDGPNKFCGRVEVQYPVGKWGTVCDYGFEEEDAKVICKSLGYSDKSVRLHLRSFYKSESAPLEASISHLKCQSFESDISDCDVEYDWGKPYAFCNHTRQVGIQCDTPVRLYGGRTKYSGRLEVYYNGQWGTVCSQGFDQKDAQAVCGILGYSQGDTTHITIHEGIQYDNVGGHIVLHNLNCTGKEEDLHECGTLQWANNACNHGQDITLNCRNKTEIRLMHRDTEVDTNNPKEADIVRGRIEVLYDGQWGTICNDHFDDDDATVLCSMKGYTTGLRIYETDTFGSGKGPITVDDLYCIGGETDVSECMSREWAVHDCGHDEDVVIQCYYEENPDPCKAYNHYTLPHFDSRYVHFNTEGLQYSFNDSKLAPRWYNVGKETMPNFAPNIHSCGTIFPIYLRDSDNLPTKEDGEVERTACQMTNMSDCGHQYTISIKQCQDGGFVYKLGPTVDEQSGYCFGIGVEGEVPKYTADHVVVTLNQTTNNFICDFTRAVDKLFYMVVWQILGDREITLSKGYCNKDNITLLELTAEDLSKHNMKMGFRLVCSVRAYKVPGGPPGRQSDLSSAFFAGIQILTPAITMRRGETKAVEFKFTVPFRCIFPGCLLTIHSFTPDYGNCNSNSLSFSSGNCGLSVKEGDTRLIQHLNITSGETGQYGVAGHFEVFLQTGKSRHHPLWDDIKLPPIDVEILPESDRKWRGKLCAVRNDPHVYTFDGRQYEHHVKGRANLYDTKGTFTLYKNVKYGNDVEIQHRVTHCTTPDNPAMCNCGLAVRAGRDVYVINVCDNNMDISYKHCGDNSLTVKKEDDTIYTIYLPYGTAVRARIDIQPWMGPDGGMALDISVNPSLYDQEGNSRGLCGTLDGNTTNDFHANIADDTVHMVDDRIEFIKEWMVDEENDMFSSNVAFQDYKPWLFPVCVCNNDGTADGVLPCKNSMHSCTPGVATGTHSCPPALSTRSRRSIRSIKQPSSISKVQIPRHMIAKPRAKRNSNFNGPWTNESAYIYCNNLLSDNNMYNLCQKIPLTHTAISLDNCVLDILLTNMTEWSILTLQSMHDTCMSTVTKNTTVREEAAATVNMTDINPVDVYIADLIAEDTVSCKFNCNNNGICINGHCDCDDGFGGIDCAVNTTIPPHLDQLLGLDQGLCDEGGMSKCDIIYALGGFFLDNNLTCLFIKTNIDIHGHLGSSATMITSGTADTLSEVQCPVPHNTISSSFVTVYDVSVSNTGYYGNELRMYVYNSSCQSYMNHSEANYTFSLKDGTCHIEGRCYSDGETNANDGSKVCIPSNATDEWTIVPTTPATTTMSTTTEETTVMPTKFTKYATMGTKLIIKVNYKPNEDLSNSIAQQKYIAEAQKQLQEFYLRKQFDVVDLTVTSVQQGSLIVAHTLSVNNWEYVDYVLMRMATEDTADVITFFGLPSDVMSLSFQDQYQICAIYTNMHGCSCEVASGRPRCRVETNEEKTSSSTVWIHITAGLGTIILVLTALLIYKHKTTKNLRRIGQDVGHEQNLGPARPVFRVFAVNDSGSTMAGRKDDGLIACS